MTEKDGVAIARAFKLEGYPHVACEVLKSSILASPDVEVPEDLRGLSDAGLHLEAARSLARAGLDAEARIGPLFQDE